MVGGGGNAFQKRAFYWGEKIEYVFIYMHSQHGMDYLVVAEICDTQMHF